MRIQPTVPQHRFIQSSALFPAMVAGFGAGKTEALIVRRLMQAFRYPKNSFAFYEPTYDLIRQIAWPRFEEKLTQLGVPFKLFKSPLNELHIEGCGKIIFRSMDTPSRIIGYEVADSDLDELDTLKRDAAREVWQKALARNRQKKPGGAANTMAVATTPEGFRFVYEKWQKDPMRGSELIRAPTSSNAANLPDGYIDNLRDQYPSNLIDAYLEGRFVNLQSGAIYIGFNRDNCLTSATIEGGEPLHIGMDFNVGAMAAVVFVRREQRSNAVDEIVSGYDTPDMIRIIKNRYPEHQIIVYPDSSGDSRKAVDASKTDIKLLRQAGFQIRVDKRNPPVRDRINSMNLSFERGNQRINPDKCPTYLTCVEQQTYDKNGMPDKDGGLDHHTDAAGYYIHKAHPVIGRIARQFDFKI